jgi:ribonuclease P/MRP protein subunit RPP40
MQLKLNVYYILVFLDFQRAFETIDRENLLRKLEMYGIGAKALLWFKSYLSDRSQIVKINGVTSEPLENDLGVPQGAVLGPILFILYINDLKDVLQHCKIKLFADDTLIYICSKDIKEATSKLNNDLNCLFNKINHDKLKINVKKTKLMIISNKKFFNKNEIHIKINNELIKLEHEIKYLGVILDDKLNLNENLNYVIRKMAKKVNVLYRTADKLNKEQKLQIYKTTIEPHINYCSSVLFLSNETEMNRLQKDQNKCMRCILKTNRFGPSNILLSSLGLLNCKQQIIMNTLVSIYKIVHNLWPMYLSNKIKHNRDNSRKNTLRSRDNLQTNTALKGYTQNSLFYKGINMYNKLPIEIRNEENVYGFKTKLIEYLKNILD